MPFSWKNPVGYLVAASLESIMITYACFIATVMVSTCISSYLFEMSLTKDLNNILKSMNKNSKIKENRRNLHAQFTEFVDVHSATKQFS